MALLTTVTISSEVLANSLGATGNVLSIVSNTAQVNLAAAAANTQNGNVFRVSVAGVTPSLVFGSESNLPSVILAIAIGANGNAQDQIVCQGIIPASPAGAWSADAILTCRKNATFGGTANANTLWTAVLTNISSPAPFFGPAEVVLSGPTTNGAINVQLSNGATAYTSNLANITVLAAVNTGQNANTLVESLIINQAF